VKFKTTFSFIRFYSNGGADNERDGVHSPNPFSSSLMSDFGGKSGEGLANPFASPDGGGYVYSNVVNPFADMVQVRIDPPKDVFFSINKYISFTNVFRVNKSIMSIAETQ
jgi:hypothetical protein